MGESWRWQLRDSEGQWIRMGSKVKWLARGKWLHGTVVGSNEPGYATVRPTGGGPSRAIDTRRISVEAPALPPQPKSDAGIGRPTRVPKPKDVPAAAKTPDPEEQRRQWWLQRTGSPGPTGTPEQIAALSPVDKGLPLKEELRADENKRRDLLKIAAEAKPGTHVWRGETLNGTSQAATSTGIHWSASPSPVITKAPDMIGADQTDVIWHGVIEEDTQGVPRSHPMWRGIHRSMDSEAEVRLRPGTHIRILGVRENGEYHKVDRRLIVENKGDLQYEDVPSFAVPAPLEPHGIMVVEKGATTVTTKPRLRSRSLDATVIPRETGKGFRGIVTNNLTGERISQCDHRHANRLTAQTCADEQKRGILFPPIKATERTAADGIEILSVTPDTSSDYPRVTVTPYRDGDMQVESFWLNGPFIASSGRAINKDGTLGPLRKSGSAQAPPKVVAAFRSLDNPNPAPDTIVKVKDAQPEIKSPKVQAAEKKALAVKTDTRLAEIYEAKLTLKTDQERLTYDIHRSGGSVNSRPRYSSGPAIWDRPLDEAMTKFQGQPYDRASWERSVAKYQANKVKLDALDKEAGELNQVYLDAGTWTRAFLVTNQGGHVHRSMSCSTCYPTTRFHWLPEYSGSDENQIVDDAGERACTVCYPSAPVDTLKRATKIFSEDEKTAAIARQERAAAKIAREVAKTAKAISNADGTDLWVMDAYDIDRSKQPRTRYSPRRFGEHLKTEVAARQWYVRHEADMMIMKATPEYRYGSAYNPEAQEQILLALAAKHSTTIEEIRAGLATKAKARANKQLREMGKPKIA